MILVINDRTAAEYLKVTFLIIYNYVKLFVTSIFFTDQCFKNIFHYFHQCWTINVFRLFKFLEGIN